MLRIQNGTNARSSLAVRRQGSTLKAHDLLAFYEGKIAKWWMPDDVLFVDELPHGATGKVLKTKLRELYGNRDFAAISQTGNPPAAEANGGSYVSPQLASRSRRHLRLTRSRTR